jgi:ribosomal protein S8
MLLFNKGQQVERMTGALPRQEIEKRIAMLFNSTGFIRDFSLTTETQRTQRRFLNKNLCELCASVVITFHTQGE